MDFTRKKYRELLVGLKASGYEFITFADYCRNVRPSHFAIMRHDVDLRPVHSLATAKIEADMGIRASYYFRAVPESWNEAVIKEIASLGHEVGYHYESLTTTNGDMKAAYEDFKMNLNELRLLAPVQTICMHGSPKSMYDSKAIWKSGHSYRELEIIGEPYFDVDFSDVFYLTDTGRRWDGYKVSVRDRIDKYQDIWCENGLVFHTTDDIIKGLLDHTVPPRLMITTHPQRWNDSLASWIKELVLQYCKNIVKFVLVRVGRQ